MNKHDKTLHLAKSRFWFYL